MPSHSFLLGVFYALSATALAASSFNDPSVLSKRALANIDSRAEGEKSFTDDGEFKKQSLNAANEVRKMHNATALTWDDNLSAFAEKASENCVSTPSHGIEFGENIAFSNKSAADAIESWVPADVHNLNITFDSDLGSVSASVPDPGEILVTLSKIPDFTQLVWKSTTKMGCGRTVCRDTRWMVVCEFSPKGNDPSAYRNNVQGMVEGKGSKSGLIGAGSRTATTGLAWVGFAVAALAAVVL